MNRVTAIGVAAANFLVLQWLGLRLGRVDYPGRVWVTARGSLRRDEMITTEDVDLSSARPVRRWELRRRSPPRRQRVLLAIGSIAFWVCVGIGIFPSQDEGGAARLALSVVRSPGEAALRSRCGECAQPDDSISVSVRGPSRGVHGVRVYRDGALLISCADCSSLSFVIPSIGRYLVFGVTERESCLLDGRGMDGDLARLAKCGAEITTSEIYAR